jgi:hypothetical protein
MAGVVNKMKFCNSFCQCREINSALFLPLYTDGSRINIRKEVPKMLCAALVLGLMFCARCLLFIAKQ